MPQPDPPITTISTKGQVILPKVIRQRRDWDTAPDRSSKTRRRTRFWSPASVRTLTQSKKVSGMLPHPGAAAA